MISKFFAIFSAVSVGVFSMSVASAGSDSPTVTVDFAVRTAHKLCDVASPISKPGMSKLDSREKNRDCLEDVLTSLSPAVRKSRQMGKSDFYGIVLNVCDKHSDGIFSRYTNCLRQARKFLAYDKNLVEMRGCKNAVCVESVLRCEKDFPSMKHGMRNRESSVATMALTQNKSRLEASEEWAQLSLLEVTDQNAVTASQCLLNSYDIYKKNEGTEIIRDSIRTLLSNIRADFQKSVGYTGERNVEESSGHSSSSPTVQ